MTSSTQLRARVARILHGVNNAMVVAIALGLGLALTQSAQAQTRKPGTQIFFDGKNGEYPYAGLIRDSEGNLYGTVEYGGGAGGCSDGCGAIFTLSPTGKLTLLYRFAGKKHGAQPYGGLVQDADGNFYGTTVAGGAFDYGTVFKLSKAGKLTVLYSFNGSPDGAAPLASLLLDSAGDLYGTTYGGGTSNTCSNGCGTVFKVSKTGKETVLHSFVYGGADGAFPNGRLIQDAEGNLYGTTSFGGNSRLNGVVFELEQSGKETILHSFTGYPDGSQPMAGLIQDLEGNFYGTTMGGGSAGYGTVFKLDTGGDETVLYSFAGGTSDGAFPYAGLVSDAAGNLYGTTAYGGKRPACPHVGCGTIFKVVP